MADHKNRAKEDNTTPDKPGNSSIGRLICLIAAPVALICFFLPWIGVPRFSAFSGYDLAKGLTVPLLGQIGWPSLFIIPISMLVVIVVLLSKRRLPFLGSLAPVVFLVGGILSVLTMLYHYLNFNSQMNQGFLGAIGAQGLVAIYAGATAAFLACILVTTGGILDLSFRDNNGGGKVYDALGRRLEAFGEWLEAFKKTPFGKFAFGNSPLANAVKLLVIVGVLLVFDQVSRGGAISPYISRILMLSGIAITLAVSLNLINGFTGQFSIGHAGFMAVGAYSSAYFSVSWGFKIAAALGDGTLGWVVALTLATIVGAACAAVAGLLVGVPSLRLKGDYLAIVTLGFGQIIVVFLNNIEAIGGARGYSGIPIVKSFFWIFLIAILTIVIVYNIVHSAFGRALISIREDELAAEAMGVNTTRYKVMAFVISSALAGAGGVLLAHFDGYLNPKSFEFIKSFEILIMIILGGLGSIVGSVLGAILLTILPEALRGFAQYRMVIYSLLLIVLMITRPQGLLGKTDVFKKWRARLRGKREGETPVAGGPDGSVKKEGV